MTDRDLSPAAGSGRFRAIVVLGMPEAGTETLSRALVAAGVTSPADPPPDSEGFGTSRALTRFNGRMLAELGIDADNTAPLSVVGKTLAQSRGAIVDQLIKTKAKRAEALIVDAAAAGSPFLLHDPQLPLLALFWRTMLDRAKIETRFVVVTRNPIAVADMARTASQQPPRRTWFLWQYLTLEMLEAAPDAAIVSAIDLVADPDTVARSLLWDDMARDPAPIEKTRPLPLHPRDGSALKDAPLVSRQALSLDALLSSWASMTVEGRRVEIAELRARLDEAMTVTGIARPAKMKPRHADPASAPLVRDKAMHESQRPAVLSAPLRPLIFHYHLFKNAGSSVDAMLRENFGDGWLDHEFPGNVQKNKVAVSEFLKQHSDIDAFSSHTALLPVPNIAGRSIFPILFIRHPLLRLRSAYGFDRRRTDETKGSQLAKTNDFAGYISTLLADSRNRQARNFQSFRLSFGSPGTPDMEHERAKRTLGQLPFVGLVEEYDSSVARLNALLKPMFPSFEAIIVRRNVEDPGDVRTIAEKLENIERELGFELYQRLAEANRDDIALFCQVQAMYAPAGQ